MADVTVKYKNNVIAEMSEEDTKVLKTSGKYCEGDIVVSYEPPSNTDVPDIRCKTYDITLDKASGWVLLTTLDTEVLSHINDPNLVVSLTCTDDYSYVFYAVAMIMASNNKLTQQSSYPVYGLSFKQTGETTNTLGLVYYPANNTDTASSLGGGLFRIDGNKYYVKPMDGFVREGNYRLTFAW